MDVYSLGTVLLKIAEWRPLKYLVQPVVDVDGPEVSLAALARIQEFLLGGSRKVGTSRLRTKVGDMYTDACLLCLGVDGQQQESQEGE